jgi:hypothetical protein
MSTIEKIKFTKGAKFSKNQINLALESMKNLRDLVHAFIYVKNPVGQYFQRIFDYPIIAVIKVAGRKTAVTVELPPKWTPAVNPKPYRRNKGEGAMFLKYLTAGAVDDANVIPLACELLAWDAAKLSTATQTSKEGALHASAFRQREAGGLTLESLTIGKDVYARSYVVDKAEQLSRALSIMVEAGIVTPQKSSRVINVNPTVKL